MPHLRNATPEDRDFLIELNESVYRELVIHQFGVWNRVFQETQFEHKRANYRYQVIEEGNERTGALCVTDEPGAFSFQYSHEIV